MTERLKKHINKKVLMIAVPVIILIIAGIIVLVFLNSNETYETYETYETFKSYRIIKLERFDGKVEVQRNKSPIDLFAGLQLIGGDVSSTGDESMMTLLIDSDKYMSVTPNTVFEVNASGSEDNGKVTIDIMSGKAVFDVKNKLSGSSTFEVNTPNATTSIKGTTFTTSYDPDRNSTHVSCDKGMVSVAYGDGKTYDVKAGEYVTVTNDVVSDQGSADVFEFGVSFKNVPDYLDHYDIGIGGDTADRYKGKGNIIDGVVNSVFDDSTRQRLNSFFVEQLDVFYEDCRNGRVDAIESAGPQGGQLSSAQYVKDVTPLFRKEFTADFGDGMKTYRIERAEFCLAYDSYIYVPDNRLLCSNSPDETFPEVHIGRASPHDNGTGGEYRYTYYYAKSYDISLFYSPVDSGNDT